VNQLTHELDMAKEKIPLLYSWWEELDAIKLASERS